MKYKKEMMIARDLGRLFGVTSHTVGSWLDKLELRDQKTKYPTWFAKREGYCSEVWQGGFSQQVWVAEKVVPKFIELGNPLIINLPDDLVYAPPLTGPFQMSGKTIYNSNGEPVADLGNDSNAQFVCKLLNCAYKAGKL